MSEIDYSKLRSLTAKKLISALRKDGFKLDRKAGSHRQYLHPGGRRVTVSFHHWGDTFRPKILKTMIEGQAKWTGQDLKKTEAFKVKLCPYQCKQNHYNQVKRLTEDLNLKEGIPCLKM